MENTTPVAEATETTKYNNLGLVLFTNQKKQSEKSPDYFLKLKVGEKKWELFGAAWKSKTGGDSLQIKLDLDKVASYHA